MAEPSRRSTEGTGTQAGSEVTLRGPAGFPRPYALAPQAHWQAASVHVLVL
jgi:hypothetical protein